MATVSMFERVCLAMKSNDLPFLQDVYKKYLEKFRALPLLSSKNILYLLEDGSLLRNYNAEVYLPKKVSSDTEKSAIALW